MDDAVRILAFSGSSRADSWNERVLAFAIAGAREAGAYVNQVRLAELELPLFDPETPHGKPSQASFFQQLLLEHDGLLIGCPEYNATVTPLLLNTVAWATRREPEEGPMLALRGKVAGLVGASPNQWGATRALSDLRAMLQNLGVLVMPQTVAVAHVGDDAFDREGHLLDHGVEQRLIGVGRTLQATIHALKSP